MTNITDLHTHEFFEEVEAAEIMKRIPVAVFVGLLAVVGIVGNFHILIVFSRNQQNHSTYHIMISALAVSDLFVCVTYLPVEIAMVMMPFSFNYDVTCRLAMLNSYIWGIWTAFLILLIAIERYRRICHPVSEQITCSTARKLCAALFLLASLNAAPVGYIAGTHSFALSNTTNGYECFVSDTLRGSYLPMGYFIFLLVEVLLIGFAIVLFYMPIRKTIQRSMKHRHKLVEVCGGNRETPPKRDPESIFSVIKTFRIRKNREKSRDSSLPTINIEDDNSKTIRYGVSSQNINISITEHSKTDSSTRQVDCVPTSALNSTLDVTIPEISISDDNSLKKRNGHSAQNNDHVVIEQSSTNSSTLQVENTKLNTLKSSLSVTSTESLDCSKLSAKRSSSSKLLCAIKRVTVTRNVTKITVGLFLIAIIFFVTLITFMVLILLRILAKDTLSNMSATEAYIFLFGFELGYLNHVVNCFIYFYNDRRFRKKLRRMYTCCHN